MIEEAAGTRMYESKKQQAVKTMEKKQSKLNEIEAVCQKKISFFINILMNLSNFIIRNC